LEAALYDFFYSSGKLEDSGQILFGRLSDFADKYANATFEAQYGLQRKFESKFDFESIKSNLLFVVSRRTTDWAKGRGGYFPQSDWDLLTRENINKSGLTLLKNINDQVYVFGFN
jgi:hypothetical protein